jgi:tRNA A37 threonylcarbamoyladenosine dehydratase
MNKKVTYFSSIYSKMHKHIIPHGYEVTQETLQNHFQAIDFVFVCIDGGDLKQEIIETLVEMKIPFIDCGIGVLEVDGSITGTTRLTTSNSHQQHSSTN